MNLFSHSKLNTQRIFLNQDRLFLQRLSVLVPSNLFSFPCHSQVILHSQCCQWRFDATAFPIFHIFSLLWQTLSHIALMLNFCTHDARYSCPSSLFSISCVCCCYRDVQAGARVGHYGDGLESYAFSGTVAQTAIWELGFCFGNGCLWCIRRQPTRALQTGPTSPVSHDLAGIVCWMSWGFVLQRRFKMWSLLMCVSFFFFFFPGAILRRRLKIRNSKFHYVPPGILSSVKMRWNWLKIFHHTSNHFSF